MKAGWSATQIGQIADIAYGYTEKASFEEIGPKFLRITDIQDDGVNWTTVPFCRVSSKEHIRHRLLDGDIVFARTGATTGKSYLISNPPDAVCASYLIRLRLKDRAVSPEFVQLFFQTSAYWEAVNAGTSGSAQGGFNASKLAGLSIPLPPLEEQRRIVAVLGKAFAGITSATANAQKNLTNASALFESYLDSLLAHRDDSWVISRLGSVATLQRGFDLPTQDRVAGDIPLVSSSGIIARIAESRVMGPGVTTGRSGSIGNVFYIDEPYWPLNTSLYVKDFHGNHPRFVFWLLRHFDLEKHATGSGVPTLNRNFVHDEEVWIPTSREVQIKIAQKLDVFHGMCGKLKATASMKLAALAELKQSLLQKAFAGEFTTAVSAPNTSVANDNFATPLGTARIIAFAYRRHQMQGQQQTYGRVKAQKSLHLVESIGGIDLGRQPMKDAAGPNDFPHMLRAEEWAEAQGFFKFVPRASGNGYDFKKLANYDTMWADAVAATEPVAAALEKAIDPIVPMVSLDAEVFATVHAAWNNLIRDNGVITDDSIVKAARDDWHSAKLKIPEHKFRDAIRTIKAKNMEPDGSAKYVGGQVKLI